MHKTEGSEAESKTDGVMYHTFIYIDTLCWILETFSLVPTWALFSLTVRTNTMIRMGLNSYSARTLCRRVIACRLWTLMRALWDLSASLSLLYNVG